MRGAITVARRAGRTWDTCVNGPREAYLALGFLHCPQIDGLRDAIATTTNAPTATTTVANTTAAITDAPTVTTTVAGTVAATGVGCPAVGVPIHKCSLP